VPPSALRIAVLLNPSSSLPMALLFRTVFQRTNCALATDRYVVELVTSRPATRFSMPDVTVATRRPRGRYDYLVVTPYDGIDTTWQPDPADVKHVQRQHAAGGIVASACLGALTLAESGVLDGREATTHWNWIAHVRARYPRVAWNTRRLICAQQQLLTAGGYLATVDLALHIVAATSSRETAHEVGRLILADSARQYQSIYAMQLTNPATGGGELRDLERWLGLRLRTAPTVEEMAEHCNMSRRSLHRKFRRAYGITPRKYLQLKRIDTVRRLLTESRRSIEQILDEVGVSDVTSFRRTFQRELGYSPAEYRRRLGQEAG